MRALYAVQVYPSPMSVPQAQPAQGQSSALVGMVVAQKEEEEEEEEEPKPAA